MGIMLRGKTRWGHALGIVCCGLLASRLAAQEASEFTLVGVGKVDITPAYPVRLAGYAARSSESEVVRQKIYVRALAFGGDGGQPAILLTADNCGVPAAIREEVASRLARRRGLDSARLAVCSTHTHSAPWLNGYAPNLSLTPLTSREEKHRDRYTREFTDALEQAALQAWDDRRLARLTRGLGRASFAANRRTKDGPVDHEVPVMLVFTPGGGLRAVFASYACHCTTLTGEFNQVCGDWAGYAAEQLEAEHPGATALVAIGCGGDANPQPRSRFDLAEQHGRELAGAVDQVLRGPGKLAVEGSVECQARVIHLPLDTLPTRAEWEARARETNFVGNHARLQLARLDRGEALRTALPYLVQVWDFGRDLSLVFLPGEVVVDYSLRLKREFDASRLWINAYANDVPCYIPSERVLREGGYEGSLAMIYYDQPNRFAPGIEDRIINAVAELLPRHARTEAGGQRTGPFQKP